MNPKRAVLIGAVVLMLAMAVIPTASALTITRTQFDLVPGVLANAETYATVVGSDNVLYIAAINPYDNELAVYSWEGQGTLAEERATIEMGNYVYTPTDMIEFDGNFYISTMNTTNLGIDQWETNLYVFDPEDDDIDLAEALPNAMLVQMAVLDDELIVAGDQNVLYSSDDGEDFTTHYLSDTYSFEEGVWYAYDVYVLGLATMGDQLYVETRNCSSYYEVIGYKTPNQPMSAPNQPLVGFSPLDDEIEIYDTDDIDETFSINSTQLSLSRTLNFRTAVYANYSNPLYVLPSEEAVAIVANSAVYGFDEDYDFSRYFNGDSSYFNPTPVFGSPLIGVNHDSKVYVNTVNSANQAPSCPSTLFEPPREYGQPPVQKLKVSDNVAKKVMQGFDATSAQVSTRVTYIVDTITGETQEVFSHTESSLWDATEYSKGSYILVSSTGVFTYHQVILDLSNAINTAMMILLVIGLCFLAFGVLSWNKGFEDILSFSLAGVCLTDAALLFFFPQLYLGYLLLFTGVMAFFIVMYALLKMYPYKQLGFKFETKDAAIVLGIITVVALIEVFTGFFGGLATPPWIPV
jgi:hypothetical protein